MRPRAQYDELDRLLRWGMNDCQIARLTGIPRGTIRDWRRRGPSRRQVGRPRNRGRLPQMRPRASPASGVCISARPLSGRWVHLRVRKWGVQASNSPRPEVPRDHRADRLCDGSSPNVSSHEDRASPQSGLCRADGVLEALALPLSSTWPRTEARAADRAANLAGGDHAAVPGSASSRAHPLRWMSRPELGERQGLA